MNGPIEAGATCFGKIPARGDFVKGAGHSPLIGLLDTWVSRAMAQLSEDPRWKITYDNAAAFDFAFVGARSRVSIVGHLRPSTDSAGRRFPFITAATIERDDTLLFRCGPAALGPAYASLAQVAEIATGGADVPTVQAALDRLHCAADFDAAIQTDPLGGFVRRTTLGGLAEMLGAVDPEVVARIVLAIGLLLRPVVGQQTVRIDKDLRMPLPAGDEHARAVAGLWLYLVSAFLRRTDIELQIVIERRAGRPQLIIGFNGAAPETLRVAWSPDEASAHLIDLRDPAWIDSQPALTDDYGVAKLAAYLAQPGITLELAINTFREVFLGE